LRAASKNLAENHWYTEKNSHGENGVKPNYAKFGKTECGERTSQPRFICSRENKPAQHKKEIYGEIAVMEYMQAHDIANM